MPSAPMSDRASELLDEPVVATAWLVPVGTHLRPVMGVGLVAIVIRNSIDHVRGRRPGLPIATPPKTLLVATPTRLATFDVRRIRFHDVIEQPSAVMAHGDLAEVRLGGNKLNTTQSLDLVGADGSRSSYEAYLRGTPGAQVRAVLDALGAADGAPSPPVVDRRGVPTRDIAAIVGIVAIIVAVVVLVLTKMPG